MADLKQKIVEVLKEVYDPEIPVNIYDLGLIYNIEVDENKIAHILMTLTSPTCPTADYIMEMIKDAIRTIEGIKEIDLKLTFEPLWTPDRVSMDAKEELGLVDHNIEEVKNTFSNKDDFKVCFDCGISENDSPLFFVQYKGKNTHLCFKCALKFS